jgi:hypothetical protein
MHFMALASGESKSLSVQTVIRKYKYIEHSDWYEKQLEVVHSQ